MEALLCSERPEQGSSLFPGKLKFSPKPTPSHQVACSWEECKAAHLRVCEAFMPTLAGLKPNAAFSHFIWCLRSLYHAAKQLEGALLVCREQGRLEEVDQPNIKKYDIAAGGGPCQQRWPAIQTSWEPRVSGADAGEWLSCPDEILPQYDLEKQQVSREEIILSILTSYLGKSSQNSWTRNTRKCCVPLWESCWYCEYYSQYITLTKIMAFHEPVAENRWAQKIDHQRQLSI